MKKAAREKTTSRKRRASTEPATATSHDAPARPGAQACATAGCSRRPFRLGRCRACYDQSIAAGERKRAPRGSIAGSVVVELDGPTLRAVLDAAGASGPSVVEWVRAAIRMRLAQP